MILTQRHHYPVNGHDIRLYTLLAEVPEGRVVTYGQLADLTGFPRRARWVGQLLKNLPEGSRLPWHRVIKSRGQISLPMDDGGLRQAELLRAEGVEVSDDGRISLKHFRWKP